MSSDTYKGLETAGIAAAASTAAYLLYTSGKAAFSKPALPPTETKYQAGEAYADPKEVASSLQDDLRAVGIKKSQKELHALLETVLSKGKPLDDKKLTVSFANCMSVQA
jgi:hypothetical protein